MSDELMLYCRGELKPNRADKPLTGRAKDVYDEARFDAFVADSHAAVGTKMMDNLSKLHRHGLEISADDPTLLMLTSSIVRQVAIGYSKTLDRRMSGWGF